MLRCLNKNTNRKMKKNTIFALAFAALLGACGHKADQPGKPQEDIAAKKMLQGIWVDDDAQTVAFKIKGDTIYYPDTTSIPAYFQIIEDTLVLHGGNIVKYPIVKQAQHLFIFKNQNGDEVKLVLSSDPDNANAFRHERPQVINQNQTIRRDTVVAYNGERYHCYVQVNPTTFKVVKSSYNDEGVEVGNIYYDNIVNLNIYHGATKLFSRDFRKQQFATYIPKNLLNQAILNDLLIKDIDHEGIHYLASLGIPDNMSSFQVEVTVGFDGKLNMKQ